MSNIKLVTPFTASCNNHQSLLNTLKQKPAPIEAPLRVFQVPVRSDVDVDDIIGQNDRKMPENSVESALEQSSDTGDAPGISDDVTEDAAAEETPACFMDLGSFQPKNRLEQITTVFLQDFPALRPKQVEKVFSMIVDACPMEIGKEFVFSLMAESINDTRGVFVRFSSVKMTQWAKQVAPVILSGVTAVFDENLSTLAASDALLSVETGNLSDWSTVAASIAAIFANKKLYSRRSGRSGTEDLDEVMQYYRTYKVENSELVEVPKELKSVIVKDIIKFRAKVLTLERESRKKEIEKERRKAKLRLTSIFEGIRASAAKDQKDPSGFELEAEHESSASSNPLDSLSDAEYAAHVAAEQKKLQDDQYRAQYKELRALEDREKAKLLERLQSARNYESALIENKLAHMDEFKMFEDDSAAAAASLSSSGFSAAVGAKIRLYYNNHGEYLRVRNHERSKEEAMDDADRVEEAAYETQPPVKVHNAPKGKVAQENVAQKEKAQENVQEKVPQNEIHSAPLGATSANTTVTPKTDKTPATVIVSAFSEPVLAALKDKIGSLIEEFLGIREDLLIDFIYDFVLDNNLDSGDELITELQETLDEDSKTVVDQLHEYIATL